MIRTVAMKNDVEFRHADVKNRSDLYRFSVKMVDGEICEAGKLAIEVLRRTDPTASGVVTINPYKNINIVVRNEVRIKYRSHLLPRNGKAACHHVKADATHADIYVGQRFIRMA